MVIRRLFKALWVVLGTAFLLICLLNLVSHRISATAGPFDIRLDGKIWNPPQCIVKEKRIGFVFVSTEELWEHGVALGTLVTTPDGNVLIALDKTHFGRMPPELQRFIVFHECAHVRLDHARWLGLGKKAEEDADCMAIKGTVEEGWTPERYEVMFAAMKDPALMIPATKGILYNEEIAEAHAWTPEERVEHAKSCIAP